MARDALVASCQCVATTPLEKKFFILFEYVRYFRKRGASMVVRTRANDVRLIIILSKAGQQTLLHSI